MTQKQRSYEDYLRLGLKLHEAREALGAALVEAGRMFGSSTTTTRRVEQTIKHLDKARSLADDRYCQEPFFGKQPTEMPRYPLYPSVWLEENPVCRAQPEDECKETEG
jgi:hypothetical protein